VFRRSSCARHSPPGERSRGCTGHILVLSQGQKSSRRACHRVPQPARDESALTGESVGADKSPEPVAPDAPLAERSSMVFGSTFITHAPPAVAVGTGMQTEVGSSLPPGADAERPTPFQVEVQRWHGR